MSEQPKQQYFVTYLTFSSDGSHSRPLKAICPSEKVGRGIIADMVEKHKSEAPFNDADISYRLSLFRGDDLIFEESRGVL